MISGIEIREQVARKVLRDAADTVVALGFDGFFDVAGEEHPLDDVLAHLRLELPE